MAQLLGNDMLFDGAKFYSQGEIQKITGWTSWTFAVYFSKRNNKNSPERLRELPEVINLNGIKYVPKDQFNQWLDKYGKSTGKNPRVY